MMNFLIDSKSIKDDVIQIQSRSMSDPRHSDIDFKYKMAWVWTTLKLSAIEENIRLKPFFIRFQFHRKPSFVKVGCVFSMIIWSEFRLGTV